MFPEWMQGAPNRFDTVLVANRGEIAVRVLRAVKEAGLRAIAVYSKPDSESLHVEIADEAILLPDGPLSENYLNQEAISKPLDLPGPVPYIRVTAFFRRGPISLEPYPTAKSFGLALELNQ